MPKNLMDVSVETLQQRLITEVNAQKKLSEELKIALERESDLRLENELLWVYLERKYPERTQDAQQVLAQLKSGNNMKDALAIEPAKPQKGSRTLSRRVRHRLGKLPGVQRTYHGMKKLIK